jgi:hypothetical protein
MALPVSLMYKEEDFIVARSNEKMDLKSANSEKDLPTRSCEIPNKEVVCTNNVFGLCFSFPLS